MTADCAWCDAPREAGDTCPSCGANYAKAEAIRAHGGAPVTVVSPYSEHTSAGREPLTADAPDDPWRHVDDVTLERKLCIGAIPSMLGVALLFNLFGLGSALQRIFFTMPVHELGHAVTAWFCGYSAIPTLWKTPGIRSSLVNPPTIFMHMGQTITRPPPA